MNLLCIHVADDYKVEELSTLFNLQFTRTIEKTYQAVLDNRWIYYTQFNVIGFVNFSEDEVSKYLHLLNLPESYIESIHETYPVVIDKSLESNFKIDNRTITLKELDPTSISIIAHVIAQSVALEVFEIQIEKLFKKINTLLVKEQYSIFNRKKIANLSHEIALFRHDIVLDLYLLDKPDMLWENEKAENLYNNLAKHLELMERFKVVEYKLNHLKDDISTIMELVNHQHSSFLEWIIIVLIGVEIVMGLYEMIN